MRTQQQWSAVTAVDTYREWPAPPEWRHAVMCCWEQHVVADRVHQILPDGHADLLWYASGRIEVVGVHDRLAVVELPRGTIVRGVRLRPEAVAPAFGTSAHLLRNVTSAAADVLGARRAATLGDRRGIDRWVRSIEPDPRTATAVRLLGTHTLSQVSQQLGITGRHLRRTLLGDVGIAPKTYQRVLRLRRFLAYAEAGRPLAAAAADAGYADQSHLTHETRALAAHTPGPTARDARTRRPIHRWRCPFSTRPPPPALLDDSRMTSPLTTIPNVGPAVARHLERLGISRRTTCATATRTSCSIDSVSSTTAHDPCLLDTFVAAVSYADGGPARPWWEFSRERKARQRHLDEPPALRSPAPAPREREASER